MQNKHSASLLSPVPSEVSECTENVSKPEFSLSEILKFSWCLLQFWSKVLIFRPQPLSDLTMFLSSLAIKFCLSGAATPALSPVHHRDRPDDGGSKDLWNVGKLLPDYTALQPRRQPSSYSPPWEPQILLKHFLYYFLLPSQYIL
jgi:hypothetical protein